MQWKDLYVSDHYSNIKNYYNELIPITAINSSISSLILITDYISKNKNNMFHIGNFSHIPFGSEIVLSLSSIIFLSKYDLLEVTTNYYDVHILEDLFQYIEKDYLQSKSKYTHYKEKVKNGKKVIDFEYSYKLNYYMEKYRISKKIISNIKKVNIIKNYEKYKKEKYYNVVDLVLFDEKINLEHALHVFDLNAAIYAKNKRYYLIVDDEFTRDIFISYIYDNEDLYSTTSGIVNSLLLEDYKLFMKTIIKMINDNYKYAANLYSILKVLYNNDDSNTDYLEYYLKTLLNCNSKEKYQEYLYKALEINILNETEEGVIKEVLKSEV